jgi:hypothetical protein
LGKRKNVGGVDMNIWAISTQAARRLPLWVIVCCAAMFLSGCCAPKIVQDPTGRHDFLIKHSKSNPIVGIMFRSLSGKDLWWLEPSPEFREAHGSKIFLPHLDYGNVPDSMRQRIPVEGKPATLREGEVVEGKVSFMDFSPIAISQSGRHTYFIILKGRFQQFELVGVDKLRPRKKRGPIPSGQ